jgi:hypothetical protein
MWGSMNIMNRIAGLLVSVGSGRPPGSTTGAA